MTNYAGKWHTRWHLICENWSNQIWVASNAMLMSQLIERERVCLGMYIWDEQGSYMMAILEW